MLGAEPTLASSVLPSTCSSDPGLAQVSATTPRLPRETLAFREELDVLKFLCKDLWVAVFQKQMDSLRTNHQVCAHAQRLAS